MMEPSKLAATLAPSLPELQLKRSVVVATTLPFSNKLFAIGKIYSPISWFRSKTASRFQINYIPSIEWPTPPMFSISLRYLQRRLETGGRRMGIRVNHSEFLSNSHQQQV